MPPSRETKSVGLSGVMMRAGGGRNVADALTMDATKPSIAWASAARRSHSGQVMAEAPGLA